MSPIGRYIAADVTLDEMIRICGLGREVSGSGATPPRGEQTVSGPGALLDAELTPEDSRRIAEGLDFSEPSPPPDDK